MNVSSWTNEIMNYVRNHVNEWVPNLEWLNDSLVKVLREHKGWSLHILSRDVLIMTLVRKVGWYFRHDLNLRCLNYYLGNLEESMGVLFEEYISLCFDNLGKENVYHTCYVFWWFVKVCQDRVYGVLSLFCLSES